MNNVLSAIPQGASRDEWLQALPRALVAGFVKTDIEFQQKGMNWFPFKCLISGFLILWLIVTGLCKSQVKLLGQQ